MQAASTDPVIPALDRFFIAFATQRPRRILAWIVVAAVLALAQSWFLLFLVPFVPLAHFYGIWVLKQHHPTLREILAEEMEAAAREACGIEEGDEAYRLEETSGEVGPGPLSRLPDTLTLTLVTPLASCAVISRHTGTIFPPRWLHPLEFRHQADGQTEIYYSDVNYVTSENGTLTLHFSNGETYALDGNNGAQEAVAALRKKLRTHKTPN